MADNFSKSITVFAKYLFLYSAFIFSVLLFLSSNREFSILPDLSIILLFFVCNKWISDGVVYMAPLSLFVFGIIIDSCTFVPIGITSFTLLIVYKTFCFIKSLLMNDDCLLFFLRDCLIFMFLFFIIKWFLFSYYKEHFYLIKYVIFDIIKEVLYCLLIKIVYKNISKNV